MAKAQSKQKTVLFLCTGNYYRSRFAEVLFNAVAAKMGLPWRAESRGLALERGVNNVGPMAVIAVRELEARGVRGNEAVTRMPVQVTHEELERADRIVALKQDEHQSLLRERFREWPEKLEYWHVDDAPGVLGWGPWPPRQCWAHSRGAPKSRRVIRDPDQWLLLELVG